MSKNFNPHPLKGSKNYVDDKVMNLQALCLISRLKELFVLKPSPLSPPLGAEGFLFLVEDIGVEPMTLCVQGRCSSQLS